MKDGKYYVENMLTGETYGPYRKEEEAGEQKRLLGDNSWKGTEKNYRIKRIADTPYRSIKTLDHAMKALGYEHPLVQGYEELLNADYRLIGNLLVVQKVLLYSELCIIIRAINEGEQPDYYGPAKKWYKVILNRIIMDEGDKEYSLREKRYYEVSVEIGRGLCKYVDSNLYFTSPERAIYFEETFSELYKEYSLIPVNLTMGMLNYICVILSMANV